MHLIEFKVKWTFKDASKHESSITILMHVEDAEIFRNNLWEALSDASANPDSITYEIVNLTGN